MTLCPVFGRVVRADHDVGVAGPCYGENGPDVTGDAGLTIEEIPDYMGNGSRGGFSCATSTDASALHRVNWTTDIARAG